MNVHQLNKPYLAEIRANLITEKLKNLPPSSSYINIYVTGRSASGKTTLGNRLIGENYFLSTGRQNTTQVVNLIDFSGGFRFFYLPGVDGGGRQEGGRLENYNRATLGLQQLPSYPNIDDITVATYRKNSLPQENTYKLNDFEKLPFKPDIVFYLIDPKKGLSRSEEDYVIDLIESGHNVIYILNVWIDKYHKPLATE
jgi:predicted GTPase